MAAKVATIVATLAMLLAVPGAWGQARPRVTHTKASVLFAIADLPVVPMEGGAAASGAGTHSVTLTWTASSSVSSCTAPCTLTYNVFKGTAAGGETVTPVNAAPVTGLTFVDSSITLQASPVTYFYTVQAVETVGSVVALSAMSNEASAAFPGTPGAPGVLTVTQQN